MDGLELLHGVARTTDGLFLSYWRHGQGGTGYRFNNNLEDIEDEEMQQLALEAV